MVKKFTKDVLRQEADRLQSQNFRKEGRKIFLNVDKRAKAGTAQGTAVVNPKKRFRV